MLRRDAQRTNVLSDFGVVGFKLLQIGRQFLRSGCARCCGLGLLESSIQLPNVAMCLVDLAFQSLYVSRVAKQAPEFASLESIEQYRVFVLCLWLLLFIGVAFTRFLACGLLGGFMLYRLACGFGRLAFHPAPIADAGGY